MWAAFVMAMGIGWVWVGGRWSGWYAGPYRTTLPTANAACQFYFSGDGSVFSVQYARLDGVPLGGSGAGAKLAAMPPLPSALWRPRLDKGLYSNWILRVPFWIPTLLCLATFALVFRIERREKRLARAGHCVCGYSLAGLADGAVCPECGKGKTLT